MNCLRHGEQCIYYDNLGKWDDCEVRWLMIFRRCKTGNFLTSDVERVVWKEGCITDYHNYGNSFTHTMTL